MTRKIRPARPIFIFPAVGGDAEHNVAFQEGQALLRVDLGVEMVTPMPSRRPARYPNCRQHIAKNGTVHLNRRAIAVVYQRMRRNKFFPFLSCPFLSVPFMPCPFRSFPFRRFLFLSFPERQGAEREGTERRGRERNVGPRWPPKKRPPHFYRPKTELRPEMVNRKRPPHFYRLKKRQVPPPEFPGLPEFPEP